MANTQDIIPVKVFLNGEQINVLTPSLVELTVLSNQSPYVQLPSDWDSTTNPTQILNKPTIINPPETLELNDFQVGDGFGSWITKKLSQVKSILGLGSAAYLNVPVVGNAGNGEVVKGNDTRLSGNVLQTRTLTTNSPLRIDNQDFADLSADRTFSIPASTSSNDGYATSTQILKLDGIENGAQVNINANWTAVSGDGFIENKPSTFAPSIHGNESHSSTFITQDEAVSPNGTIIGGTKTKIEYDSKGLVVSGSDATTNDILDSTDKRYITDAQLAILENTSGINTGDNATNSQYSGLSLSKQDVLVSGTNIKTINSASVLGSGNFSLEPALGFTPENLANKSTNVTSDGSSDTKYPTVKSVKDYVDTVASGVLNYRGGYDASTNLFPATGGTGTLGVPEKGNMWIIRVGGTLGGTPVLIGDSIIANIDNPGQTAGNWDIIAGGISYVAEDQANKSSNTSLGTSDVLYPTQNAVKVYVDTGLSGKQNSGAYITEVIADSPISGNGTTSSHLTVDLSSKQDVLQSGTNIKTINNTSLVGSGNISVQPVIGFTPENVSNKSNDLLTSNNTLYPTTKAVNDALSGKQDSGNYITGVVADTPLSGSGTSSSHLVVDLSSKQNADATLTALAGLDATAGLLRQVGADSFTKDTNTYATTSQALLIDQTTPQTIANGKPTFSDGLKLGTNPSIGSFEEGKIYYDSSNKTISAMIDTDVNMQLGQEELVLCYNNTGTLIPNGSLVYVIGAQGDMPTIALAKADSQNTYMSLGMATQDIPNFSAGFVTNRGIVHDVNTLGFTQGDILYLSDSIAGAYTNIAPSFLTSYVVVIGRVLLVSQTAGSIYIRQIFNSRMNDLLDVSVSTPSVDQILTWNGNSWINGNRIKTSAGGGISFYLDSTKIIPVGSPPQGQGLETLTKTPSLSAEVFESVTVNNSTVPIDRYLYNFPLSRTIIDGGTWTFSTYGYVNNSNGFSSIPVTVYDVISGIGTMSTSGTQGTTSRTLTITGGTPFISNDYNSDILLTGWVQTPNSVLKIIGFTNDHQVTVECLSTYINETNVSYSLHRCLFNDANTEVNDTSVGLTTSTSIQPQFIIGATDKLAVCYFGKTTASGNRTIYLYHGGTTNYTNFRTPLTTLHNELAGLQGGTSEQYYHLNSSQYSIVQNTSGTNTGDVSIGTSNGLGLSGQQLSLQTSSSSLTGALSSTDWNTFNGKQNSLGYTPINKAGDTVLGNIAINGYLTVNGLRETPLIKTSNYVVTVNDSMIVCDSLIPINIYLLPATGTGQKVSVKSIGIGAVTIVADTTLVPDNIDGEATQVITQYDCIEMVDDAINNWIIV